MCLIYVILKIWRISPNHLTHLLEAFDSYIFKCFFNKTVHLLGNLCIYILIIFYRKQFPSVANSPVVPPSIPAWQMSSLTQDEHDGEERKEDLEELGSGSGSSEHEHGMKTSESSLEIISSKDCDSESCHSRKSIKDDNEKE
ncbi:unnamed protein product [Acanthoscelides obtectus]|uniref:Uncharacterized protein n=1 Tax=Acanthoscelides obtectus TaxID=200917 RepID=A0A9P0PI35_ACAOB|nr:unnamed protein product [Acanthoscelides obtectus]CAK1620156.1 hypothetical protein AOBTE_LOCUS225 [Acanthoscelides obtectus]